MDKGHSGWKLSDGSPLPDKQYFDDPKYDAETRTFTGTINYGGNIFIGAAKKEYEIVFSEDFMKIESG